MLSLKLSVGRIDRIMQPSGNLGTGTAECGLVEDWLRYFGSPFSVVQGSRIRQIRQMGDGKNEEGRMKRERAHHSNFVSKDPKFLIQ